MGRELPRSLKVVDLSADFRIEDVDTYAEWYGHEHYAPALQGDAVYGLTEYYRERIAGTRFGGSVTDSTSISSPKRRSSA